MAKLTGAKKKAFLERMAKGRRKASRANGAKKKRKAAAAPKKRKAAAPTKRNAKVRKSKKVIGKGFTKPVAAQWAKEKKKKAAARRRAAQAKKKASPRKQTHAHNGGKTKRRNGPKRRNSDTLAAAIEKFTEFHGKEPGRIVEYEQHVRYSKNLAEMGKLKELRFFLDRANPEFPLTSFGECQAVCTPDGRNIYFIGGDQSINLEALEIASDKDMIELGPCGYIVYDTVKGFHDFQQTNYWHPFGEEDGVFPRLAYDRLNKLLFLLGGNYQVRPEGIVN